MSQSAGGILLSLGLIFLAGVGCNNAWDDETKTVTKTDVKIVKVPDTHVVTKTKTIREVTPLPPVCRQAAELMLTISKLDEVIDAQVSIILPLTKEVHRLAAIPTIPNRMALMVKATEEMESARNTLGIAQVDKMGKLATYASVTERCEEALDE